MLIPGALNYSPHAIESLAGFAKAIGSNGCPISANAHLEMVELLTLAVKFNLPENGELVALDQLDEAYADFIRLPFDAVALEAPFTAAGQQVYRGDDNFSEVAASKRIAVCWTSAFSSRFPTLCPWGSGADGFYVASLYMENEVQKNWIMCPLVSFIPKSPEISKGVAPPTSRSEAIEREFLRRTGSIKLSNASQECWSASLCPELIGLMAQHMGSADDALARLSVDIRDETMTAISFCLTVNASNVKRLRMAAPDKLNKKRLAAKKPPFFESWILDVFAKDSPAGAQGSGAGAGVTDRVGPRLHLRRGHIRRLDRDRITFVRATTVGSVKTGQIDKTYRVGA